MSCCGVGEFCLSHVVHAARASLLLMKGGLMVKILSPTKAGAFKATKYNCEELGNKFMGIFSSVSWVIGSHRGRFVLESPLKTGEIEGYEMIQVPL